MKENNGEIEGETEKRKIETWHGIEKIVCNAGVEEKEVTLIAGGEKGSNTIDGIKGIARKQQQSKEKNDK